MAIVFLAVDALNLIRRVYAGEPSGSVESALGATVQSLRRALKELSPSHAVVVFDGEEPTWRHRRYPAYKAGRKPMPEELREALPRYREAFQALGLSSASKPGIDMVAPFGASLHVSGRDESALEGAIAPYRERPRLTWTRSQPSLEDVFIDLLAKAQDNFQ